MCCDYLHGLCMHAKRASSWFLLTHLFSFFRLNHLKLIIKGIFVTAHLIRIWHVTTGPLDIIRGCYITVQNVRLFGETVGKLRIFPLMGPTLWIIKLVEQIKMLLERECVGTIESFVVNITLSVNIGNLYFF
ncbi:hypothetical protein ACJX0J_007895, partial [Zea mays]